jgi:hypothetical protein
MIISWLLPFLGGGIIGKLISFGLDLTLKLISFILYLASEYWGRWVLAGVVVFCALCYGRWHYMEVGRAREASFRELVVQAQLEERCEAKGGTLGAPKPKTRWLLPEGWP